MDILDQYTLQAPSVQDTLDIFKGEWSSRFPDVLGAVEAGAIPLFEDARIYWAAEQMGGFANKTVLELGPLEGGHTYALEQLGAASITAVEANSRAYLKCLLVKEILNMTRSHFIYSDCIEFIQGNQQHFDACIASGILYHMRNPAQLVSLLAKTCDQIFIWTHYYEPTILQAAPHLWQRFSPGEVSEFEGFRHQLYRQEYQTALGWAGFCGGSAHYSRWMSRQDILDCCKHFGFQRIEINFDQLDHPNGPCFAFVASKDAATVSHAQAVGQPVAQWSPTMQTEHDRQISQLQQQIDQMQTQTKAQTEQLQQQLQVAQNRIAAMETSKFWKLRESWFRFKKTVGLPSNE
jgi:hypothetical protein